MGGSGQPWGIVILDKPALNDVASCYQSAAQAWQALAESLLPDNVPVLKQAKTLRLEKQRLFIEQGMAATEDIQRIHQDLTDLHEAADQTLADLHRAQFFESIHGQVQAVHQAESQALQLLEESMKG